MSASEPSPLDRALEQARHHKLAREAFCDLHDAVRAQREVATKLRHCAELLPAAPLWLLERATRAERSARVIEALAADLLLEVVHHG